MHSESVQMPARAICPFNKGAPAGGSLMIVFCLDLYPRVVETFLRPAAPALTTRRIYISLPSRKTAPPPCHSFHPAFTIWSGKGAWVMVFVWDRRKIKMLYSRGLSEMSRWIVCLACVLNLEGADRGMRRPRCTSVCLQWTPLLHVCGFHRAAITSN